MTTPAVDVRGLRVRMPGADGSDRVLVSGVDLTLSPGDSLAIVGESGSGKSLTARSLLALLPPGLVADGHVEVAGVALDDPRRARPLRGRRIALLMQDPFTMLNPLRRVGAQLADGLPRDVRRNRARRRAEVARRLAEVGLTEDAARRYPFQLSGGMRQRVGIAAALVSDPDVLVADEPTTALDVTTQREILRLVRGIQRDRGMAFVLITHDLRVAFSMCERVLVMYAGRMMEAGPTEEVQRRPRHPYTAALLDAEPPVDERLASLPAPPGAVPAHDEVVGRCAFADRCGHAAPICTSGAPPLAEVARGHASACVREGELGALRRPRGCDEPEPVPAPETEDGSALLRVRGLTKSFPGARSAALTDVDLHVAKGETVGLVGESGSGKTTLARCVVGLETPSAGTIKLSGTTFASWADLDAGETRRLRGVAQMVFQDPYSSLHPVRSVGATLADSLAAFGRPHGTADVAALLELVGLTPAHARRRPAALSGGERQRVAIARALAPRPELLVCDESVSALDVSVQAQVLDLLGRLVRELGMALLFVTHDLAVVRQATQRVYVLQAGRCVESGATDQVLDRPGHEYTRELLTAVPRDDRRWLD